MRAAAHATSAGCRSSCAARSTARRRSPRALVDTERGARSRSTTRRSSRSCRRRWRACSTPGSTEPPALRWALLGGAPIPPALLERAAAARVPVAPTYGLTEACSQVDDDGVPLFCTRVELAADGEILVGGPTVAPAAATLCTPATSARSTPTGACGSPAARPTRSSPAARTSRPPRSRRSSRPTRPSPRPRSRRARPRVGRGGRRRSSSCATAPRPTRPSSARTQRRLAPFKVPKAIALQTDPLPRTASGKLLRKPQPANRGQTP